MEACMIGKPMVAMLMVGLLFSAGIGSAHAQDREAALQQATKAADAWLKLVDEEKYRESWEQAASFFKEHVTADKWAQMSAAARKPLGAMISRKFKLAQYATE